MSNVNVPALLAVLTPAAVVRAYSGKPGCMCGCRGVYRETGRVVTQSIAALQATPEQVTAIVALDDEVCLTLETETRSRSVYVPLTVAAPFLTQEG